MTSLNTTIDVKITMICEFILNIDSDISVEEVINNITVVPSLKNDDIAKIYDFEITSTTVSKHISLGD